MFALPGDTLFAPGVSPAIRLLFYLAVSSVVIAVGEALRRARGRAAFSAREVSQKQKDLDREVAHHKSVEEGRALQLEAALELQQQARAEAEHAVQLHRTIQEKLMRLVEASETLLGQGRADNLPQAILALASRLISADAYAIWRLDADQSEWRIVSAAGLRESYSRDTVVAAVSVRQFQQTPFIAEDVDAPPELEGRRDAFAAEGIKSLIAVPLLAYKAAFDTFGIDSYTPYRLGHIFLLLLCAFLVYVLARRRVGDSLAVLPAAILLFLDDHNLIDVHGNFNRLT